MAAMTSVPLLAVIGPVSPSWLETFVAHYRDSVGVKRIYLAFNVPLYYPDEQFWHLARTAEQSGARVVAGRVGNWDWDTNHDLMNGLRSYAGPGWHMIADSDELHMYPTSVTDLIAQAENAGVPVVEGMLFDRVTDSGWLPPAYAVADPDATFPKGGFFTHTIVGGESTKATLVRSDVVLKPGNHEVEGFRGVNEDLVVVHHFKWVADAMGQLATRMVHFTSGIWKSGDDDWVIREASRALNHVGTYGRIAVDVQVQLAPDRPPEPLFTPANLRELPPGWSERSRAAYNVWKNWETGTIPSRDTHPSLAPLLTLPWNSPATPPMRGRVVAGASVAKRSGLVPDAASRRVLAAAF